MAHNPDKPVTLGEIIRALKALQGMLEQVLPNSSFRNDLRLKKTRRVLDRLERKVTIVIGVKKRQKALAELRTLAADKDFEATHQRADAILLELLNDPEVAAAYQQINRQFA